MSPAASRPPGSLLGLAAITRMAFDGADLSVLGARLLERIEADPGDAAALLDLSTVLMAKDRQVALATQAEALQLQQLYHLPAPRTAPGATPLRLLAVMAPGDLVANTPIEFLLEHSDVALDLLFVGDDIPLPESVPDHDVLFVGLGESDASRAQLERLVPLLASWPRPVLNRPEHILSMSRMAACTLLRDTPGVEMPLSVRLPRQTLERVAREELPITEVLADGVYPIIVRPADSHMGRGLVRLDSPLAIARHLRATTDREYYVSRYVEYRDADGEYRKYRVALVDGQPLAVHLAVCQDWVVHYQRAGMAESADKRAEERRFMERFDDEFGRRHAAALHAIHERCGLDYLGIDCAEAPDGRLLVFEVDNAMLVHAMDPADLYPYKRPQMRKVFDAFRGLLARAAALHGPVEFAVEARAS